ncbi:glycosyltransferase [Picosynechococcus sp. NKBG042902]|uniref:glycosyltransferase n=1 Tax=Picosynechococcus sp. NKBG042902 TaxID=490193 RepID=UPI0009075DB2|nr:glycosyltransferase [Picosynechococcus sp. NKBG042902]
MNDTIKKIGIVAPEFPPEIGGVQSYSYELCCELAKRGYDLTVLVPESHSSVESFVAEKFQPINYLKLRRRFDVKMLQDFDVDIWHCLNSAYSWLSLYNSKVFISVHGNDFLDPYILTARLDLRERFYLKYGSRLDFWLGRILTKKTLFNLYHTHNIYLQIVHIHH